MSESRELTSYDEKFAKEMQDYVAQAQTGAQFISTRSGVLKYMDEELPGNQLCGVILARVFENTFYDRRFDPDDLTPPKCYAFSHDKVDMAPHESMQADLSWFEPQVEMPGGSCLSCRHNIMGTADTGRGKACQNRIRLALIPGGLYNPKRPDELSLYDDPQDFEDAPLAFMKVSPTSVKEFSAYVKNLSAARQTLFTVFTRIYIQPHPKHQFHTCFEVIEEVPKELYPVIDARHEEAKASIIQGYSPPQERDDAPRGSLKGLRR